MGFKLPGKSIQSGTSAHSSALKMVAEQKAASALKAKTSPAKETDWAAMHAKANKKYNRYKNLTTEEYKAEAQRQMAHYKKTGKWDAGGVYDHKGNKIKKDEPKQEIKEETTITKAEPKAKEEAKPTKKETIKKEKKDVKDVRKQSRINILEQKKDVAEAKGKTRRTKRLERKIERKKSRLDGDKSTNITRRDQRKKRRLEKEANKKARTPEVVKKASEDATAVIEKQKGNSPMANMKTGKYKQKFEK